MFNNKHNKKIYVLICFLIICLHINLPLCQANQDMQHPNGWIYPAGTSDTGGYYGWKQYEGHVGQDYYLEPDSPVYAMVNNGVILEYSAELGDYGSKCGSTGAAFLVKYPIGNGHFFYALYGHTFLADNLSIGSTVQAGQIIGYVHDYFGKDKNGKCTRSIPHLHFGIHLLTKPDTWCKGVLLSDNHNWVDPVKFMNENAPVLNNKTIFHFNGNDTDGWSPKNSAYQSQVKDGQWHFNIFDDPYLHGPLFAPGITTDQFQTIEISMTADYEYGKDPQKGLIYYKSKNEPFNEDSTIPIDESYLVEFDGFQKLYTAKFTDNIQLFQLRLDPVENGDYSHISIDFIRLVSHLAEWQFNHSIQGWSLRNTFVKNFDNGMKLNATSGDPGVTSPWLGKVDTGKYQYLVLNYAVFANNTPLNAKIYFDLTDDQEGFKESLAYTYHDINSTGEMAEYQIPLPASHLCRKIYQVRVDFYEGAKDEMYPIVFSSAKFVQEGSHYNQGRDNFNNGLSHKKRTKQEETFVSNITIHEIKDIFLDSNTLIEFKAYAFGCCSEKYKWEFIENPLNLSINEDGMITGDTASETGAFKTTISARELFGDQQGYAEESFVIHVNDHPDQKSLRIFNDGSGTLEISEIVLEKNSSWVKIAELSFPLSIDGGHFIDLPVKIDRSFLDLGEYSDELVIQSNDPNNNPIKIPINLNITSDNIAPLPPENISAEQDSNAEPGKFWIGQIHLTFQESAVFFIRLGNLLSLMMMALIQKKNLLLLLLKKKEIIEFMHG